MTIEKELTTRLKEAMRAKNTDELNVLRMVKSQAQAKKTSPGFTGETDDAFWRDVISRYVKQQTKALAEYEQAGEQGAEIRQKIRFEIDYLSPFLPKLKSEEEVLCMVRDAIKETGASGEKMVGKVIGWVMKNHQGEVDPVTVKRLATKELS